MYDSPWFETEDEEDEPWDFSQDESVFVTALLGGTGARARR
ncbi:hypothetical protein [Streptomyces virginiae]